MSDNVIRGSESNQSPKKYACSTCRYAVNARSRFSHCSATGYYCSTERGYHGTACGQEGKLWELRPPRERGAIERVWRWLFGGSGE